MEEKNIDGASLFVRTVAPTEADPNGSGWGLFSAATKAGPDGLTMVLASEPVEDRMGDVVAPPWQLGNFRSNPVILWGHNSYNPPVGRGEKIKLQDGRLTVGIKWDGSPLNAMGQLVQHQFREGFLNAVSVGFRSLKVTHRSKLDAAHEHAADRGYLLQRNELLELSAVSIPALQTALAIRGDAGPATFRAAIDWFVRGAGPVQVEEVAEATLETAPDLVDALVEQLRASPEHIATVANLLGVETVQAHLRALEAGQMTAADLDAAALRTWKAQPTKGGGIFVAAE